MNTSFDILVIVLSCLLGIFLIISILTVVSILKLVASVRAIVAKGEQIVDNAEALAETMRAHSGAVGIIKLFASLVGGRGDDKRKRG